jgi:hypothetical protein
MQCFPWALRVSRMCMFAMACFCNVCLHVQHVICVWSSWRIAIVRVPRAMCTRRVYGCDQHPVALGMFCGMCVRNVYGCVDVMLQVYGIGAGEGKHPSQRRRPRKHHD